MVGAFPLKFQRHNQQNALAMDSADGKTGEKAVFPQHGENTAFLSGFSADGLHDWDIVEQLDIWLCHSTCLFHLYSTLKIQPVLQFSPWQTSWLRHFVGYSLGTPYKKASTFFYDTA